MTFANTDAAEFWAGMAPTWVELEDQLEQVGGGPGEWAMDRLSLGPGALVLDVGCGTGRTTLALARRVAPGGQAVGVDISDEMLMRAQEHAEAAGTENVSFVHADAQVHDLGDAAFDAAYSRFGVMFFADPVAAFGNIRRALKPGGSLGFVCWQSVFDNEWMFVPGAAAMAATGTTPPLPGPEEPGPFAFADAGRMRSILEKAGFSDIDVVARNDVVVTAEDRIPEVALVSTRVGAVRELLRDADEGTRRGVLQAIEDAMRSRVEGGRLRMSRGVNLVGARA